METTLATDLQKERAAERLAKALEDAPAAKERATKLRAQSESLATEAAEVEARAAAEFAARANLKQAQAAAQGDLAELQRLKAAADGADAALKGELARFLAAGRHGDLASRSNCLTVISDLLRIKALGPILPALILERESSLAAITAQIAAGPLSAE